MADRIPITGEPLALYRPSNGTEGAGFHAAWCERCEHDKDIRKDPDSGHGCEIIPRTMAFDIDHPEYPKEWVYGEHGPMCTAFQEEREEGTTPRCEHTVDMFGGDR